MPCQKIFQKGMERLGMVRVMQVAQLMKHYIIPHEGWKIHQAYIQIDVLSGRTTAPVRAVEFQPET